MNYTVWIKDEYDDKWAPHECGDVEAVKRVVLQAAKEAKEIRITVEVPFEVGIKVGEPGAEVKKRTRKEEHEASKTTEEVVEDETHPDKPEQD